MFKLDHSADLPDKIITFFSESDSGKFNMKNLMAIIMKYDDVFIVGGEITRLSEDELASYTAAHQASAKKAFISGRQRLRDPLLWVARAAKLSDSIDSIYQELTAKQQKGGCTTCAINQALARVIPLLTEYWKANPDSTEVVELLTPEYIEYLTNGTIPDSVLNASLPRVLPGKPPESSTSVSNSNSELQKDRPACMFCFLKHIGSAIILLKEVAAGYTPEKGHPHFALALAHLSEAENEIIAADATAANAVREVRLSLTAQ